MITTAKDIAQQLTAGKNINITLGSDEMEPDFHCKLEVELGIRNWTEGESHSRCTKASRENHMVNQAGRRVEIISANFMGFFTQVRSGS